MNAHTKQQQDKVFETDFIGSQNPLPPRCASFGTKLYNKSLLYTHHISFTCHTGTAPQYSLYTPHCASQTTRHTSNANTCRYTYTDKHTRAHTHSTVVHNSCSSVKAVCTCLLSKCRCSKGPEDTTAKEGSFTRYYSMGHCPSL